MTEWEATKNTLHLWAQIVGKMRMASTAPRNHWWHATLYVDARGLTTRRMHSGGVSFEIDFDFIEHRLVIATNGGAVESFELADGLSVAEFDEQLHAALGRLGIDVAIRESPFGVPMTTPFPDDREHAAYDRDAVERFWRILDWTRRGVRGVLGLVLREDEPGAPVLALARPRRDALRRGARARRCRMRIRSPARPTRTSSCRSASGRATRTCASRRTTRTRRRSPPASASGRCARTEAFWADQGGGSLARLPYEAVRTAVDPRATLLAFLESAYQAGAAAWDRDDLASSWCPSAPELSDLLSR